MPTVSNMLGGVVCVSRSFVRVSKGITQVSRVLGVPRVPRASRPGGPIKSSITFRSIDFSCAKSISRGTLRGMSFSTGRKRVATVINPSNNNGDAVTGLVSQF